MIGDGDSEIVSVVIGDGDSEIVSLVIGDGDSEIMRLSHPALHKSWREERVLSASLTPLLRPRSPVNTYPLFNVS